MMCKTLLIFVGGTPSLVAAGWTASSLRAVLQSEQSYFVSRRLLWSQTPRPGLILELLLGRTCPCVVRLSEHIIVLLLKFDLPTDLC